MPSWTPADLQRYLGASDDQNWLHSTPDTAAVQEFVHASAAGNRLLELVDGALVEKPLGPQESPPAVPLIAYRMEYSKQRRVDKVYGPGAMLEFLHAAVRAG